MGLEWEFHMEAFGDHLNNYSIMIKYIFYFIFFLLLSCDKIDCISLAETYREKQCIIIAKKFPDKESGYNFEIIGTSLNTGKDTTYKEENRWFCTFYDKLSIGDTIIKRNGELIFSIYKQHNEYKYEWECNGKIYK